MSNLKKVLGALLSATVLVASGAMMASAEEDTVNLMPANKDAITANNADVTYENGKLVIKGGASEGTVSWTPNAAYDLVEKPFVYITLSTDQGFDGSIAVTANGIQRTPGMSSDFGNSFGMTSGFGSELVPAGDYVSTALGVLGAFTWDETIAKDAESASGTIDKIELKVQPNATMTLSGLFAGVEGLDGTEAPDAPQGGEDPADGTTAAANGTAGTTKKASPATGESTAMVASGVVLAVVAAGAVALTAKKKNH